MGPETLAELAHTLAPILWTCGAGAVLIVVIAVVGTR